MSTQARPSIVFAHGLWADGSCFSKLIPALQAEGHEVMASQHGLDSLASDVAVVKACLTRVSSPSSPMWIKVRAQKQQIHRDERDGCHNPDAPDAPVRVPSRSQDQ